MRWATTRLPVAEDRVQTVMAENRELVDTHARSSPAHPPPNRAASRDLTQRRKISTPSKNAGAFFFISMIEQTDGRKRSDERRRYAIEEKSDARSRRQKNRCIRRRLPKYQRYLLEKPMYHARAGECQGWIEGQRFLNWKKFTRAEVIDVAKLERRHGQIRRDRHPRRRGHRGNQDLADCSALADA
ncbi:MAG: hypothetical protein R3C40_10980 [Parvularculaceae bacterium]